MLEHKGYLGSIQYSDEDELFRRDFLHAYYRPATLASDLARRVFVFPAL